MLASFYPKEYRNSAYEISYEKFYEKGIRGVIFDIDNTLVPHGAPPDKRAEDLFVKLKNLGMDTCLMSNNRKPRVASFAEKVHSKYIYKAGKPAVKNYKKAMEMMGTDCSHTLFVGDQMFTDVYGANRAGIYGILVKPIHHKEEIQIVVKRWFEKIVLHFYKSELKRHQTK